MGWRSVVANNAFAVLQTSGFIANMLPREHTPYFGEVVDALPHEAFSVTICIRKSSVAIILSACDDPNEGYSRPPEG